MTNLDLFRSASPPPRASNRRRYASPLLVCVLTALMALLSGCSSSEEAPTLEEAPTPDLFSYVCENGTASSRNDVASEGMSRCVSCDPLYSLDGAADTIGATCSYSVDVGEAVRIGSAETFGVGEDGEGSPAGLAAIGNTLYMVGTNTDALYTVNTTTGKATRVGNADKFGEEEEGLPNGLAAIGNTLYMVGGSKDALYKVDTNTGKATRVGNAKGFGVVVNEADADDKGEHHPTGLAAIGNTLYMLGEVTAALYTLNTNTGEAKRVGSAKGFGVVNGVDDKGEHLPSGLAAIGNILYMVGNVQDVLYKLNTTTGEATQVGSVDDAFGVNESTPNGLAIIGNTLYMVGGRNKGAALYALRYQNVACTGNEVPNSDNTKCIPSMAPYSTAANADCSTTVTFDGTTIADIIISYGCAGCHLDETTFEENYSLTSQANALGNGSDSNPNVVANDPWASLLFVKVWGGQSETFPDTVPARGLNAVDFSGGRMPLNCSGNGCIDVNQDHVNAFFCWIAQGAN